MRFSKTYYTSLILLSILLLGRTIAADCPPSCKIDGVPRIKQLHNYCGPATMAAVFQCLGEKDMTQETVGKAVYNAAGGSTNGADMLYYARSKGYAAYSWNSNLEDAKKKLAAGSPIIVLQQNSLQDTSGHYRVLTGYDDATQKFKVMDPYYDEITELTYTQCDRLWRPMGHWALLIVPTAKDTWATELSARNPVVHMDLSYAMYQRADYTNAQKEAKLALAIEPDNDYSRNMLNKINRAIGAGKKNN